MAGIKTRTIFSILILLCAVSFVSGESAKPKDFPILTKLRTVPCGKQPKQVVFSPDGSCIALPLLDDAGFQIVQTGDQSVRTMYPPRSAQKGFAEALFVAEKNAFFISQMTTGYIYEYVWPGFTYRREIKTFGVWPKFISWSNEKNMLAVSNWVSNTVSLIDYETGSLVRTYAQDGKGASRNGIYFRRRLSHRFVFRRRLHPKIRYRIGLSHTSDRKRKSCDAPYRYKCR